MGFYIRKSIRLGGVRFNLSKSGVGASVGIKGFRVGAGPRGNYVHMGRNGVYYRAALPSVKSRGSKVSENDISHIQPSPQYEEDQLLFQEIESGDISLIVDASSQDLVQEINQKFKRLPFWPLALLLAFIPSVGFYLAPAAAIAIYLVIDRVRRMTIIFYDIEDETEKEIQKFYDAFNELISCSKAWHISAQADVRDRKYHAGASAVIKRSSITVQYKSLPRIKTNIRVPSIPVGKQTLYFLPDRILIFEGKQVGGLSYSSLHVAQSDQNFIESESVPRDGKIVDHTWRYVNKSGGPDKRFKDNPRLPIMMYSDLQFTSSTGLNERVEFSRANVGKTLNKQLLVYSQKRFLMETKRENLALSEQVPSSTT